MKEKNIKKQIIELIMNRIGEYKELKDQSSYFSKEYINQIEKQIDSLERIIEDIKNNI